MSFIVILLLGLEDFEVVIRTGMSSLVTQPTRLNNFLDRLYVSDLDYQSVKVVQSVVSSDHKAIIAYSGIKKFESMKTHRVCTFRKHTASQHARFLADVSHPIYTVNNDGDPQAEFDKLYDRLLELLDKYYPERTVTITSADPPYVTPVVKHMLRHKNHLMRKGRVEEATALAGKIGVAITNYTSSELSRVDVLSDPRGMWKKVRQLTGRDKSTTAEFHKTFLTADQLNDHYAAVSNDVNYL